MQAPLTEARAQGSRAIAMARQLGDPAALATNLSYMFDFTWDPEHTEELIGYATEMLTAAEQAGNMEIVAIAYALAIGLLSRVRRYRRWRRPIWTH